MDKNKYVLGLYEKAMPNGLSFEEKLKLAKKCGFDYVELSIDETDEKLARLDMSKEKRKELVDLQYQTGISFGSICLSGHRKYPMGHLDETVQKRCLEIMEKACILAKDLGIGLIQLAGYDVYYEQGSIETKIQYEKTLKKSVEIASYYGINLGFETMETEFMDTVGKAMRYVDLMNSPYLGVYPDLGNLTNAAKLYRHDVLVDIALGNKHIFAAHLKETIPNHYREIPFGTGHTDYVSGIRVLKDLGVRRFVGEFWHVGEENYEEVISSANQFLRKHLDEVFYGK